MISYDFLNKYENPLFVGLKKEHDNLKKVIINLDYFECKDFLELASIIKSSKVFIGNLNNVPNIFLFILFILNDFIISVVEVI